MREDKRVASGRSVFFVCGVRIPPGEAGTDGF
jgi:hypothetical protein